MSDREELEEYYDKIGGNLFLSNREGYWSNLDKNENAELISTLKHLTVKEAIKRHHGWLFDVIFSPKRAVGLELLELSGNEACVDYGCMWGALTIPLAKRCKYVLGVDQTLDSLKFLSAYAKEEKLENIDLLCENLKEIAVFKNKFDVAIVNGVLEWIPERGEIELKKYWSKTKQKKYIENPLTLQKKFLNTVYQSLSEKGKLYLAIENRYDYKMFLGGNDPHAGIPFVSILPRKLSNFISEKKLNRPYVNWLYSFYQLKKILSDVGFSKIDLYSCFPDYRFPDQILSFEFGLKSFTSTKQSKTVRGKIARVIETILFGHLRLKFFASSIIAVAQK
ncbi:MAG: hypothetical protein HKUEN01_33790 [Candidatus Kuenenia stuttgartiensis]|uniref:class I SAM-dependent methyltransferase n=1 Tax=Kuenenia stuttgartiensis TaxID=174633 RepID=UPI00146ABE70|nr:class I SAM-dependent methyltransferase [Candidatus Kuenenia stuttgartiensis]GJQ50993.1 MAG: hypothetical protein HKUEN01_33790 [Candidatus Kuenenia stuttgartiensis]